MKITEATASALGELWTELEPGVSGSRSFEEAAQRLADSLYEHFRDSVVLARVFVTVPFGRLPAAHQEFVRRLARRAGGLGALSEATPVLSLVGTHGAETDWNNRRRSKDHVGIPLISSSFVGAIPMISRLLREMGVPMKWMDTHAPGVIVRTIGANSGLFFVHDAAEAEDDQGRKIIAAQDFVAKYGVRSVFGTGGAYPDGNMVAIVLFCRDSFTRSVAERFLDLGLLFKLSTSRFVRRESVFSA